MDLEELFLKHKLKLILIGGGTTLLIIMIFIFLNFFNFQGKEADSTNQLVLSSRVRTLKSTTASEQTKVTNDLKSSDKSTEIYVDVKGAVNKPGMYRFSRQDRVDQAIKKAGDLTDDADPNGINYAKILADQMVLYVPHKGEKANNSISEKSTSVVADQGMSSQDDQQQVNLNTADLATLQTLTGIGEKKAQKIIEYRKINGSFKSVDDLQKISGFGAKMVDKIRDQVTI